MKSERDGSINTYDSFKRSGYFNMERFGDG